MKKFNKILLMLIIFEIFFISVSSVLESIAFKNGSFTYKKNPNHMDVSEIDKWYDESYGTHDWIAEAGLEAILANPSTRARWEDQDTIFWTGKRKVIFLIGTEAPDSLSRQTSLTLNGLSCHGMKTTCTMRFHENDNSSLKRMHATHYNTFIDRCGEWTRKVQKYLEQGKCDAAAFYMGAIVHLIGDMATWPHLLYTFDLSPSGSLGEIATNYEKAVQAETKDHNNRKKTFSYPEGFTIHTTKPRWGLKVLAFRVRWDFEIASDDLIKYPLPSYVQTGDLTAEDLFDQFYSWSRTQREEVNLWPADIKSKVQHHLDEAVKFSADAINYFSFSWKENKYCEECDDNNQTQEDYPEQWRKFGAGLTILVVLGIANSIMGILFQILSQSIYAT